MRHLIINLRLSGFIFLGFLFSNCSSDSGNSDAVTPPVQATLPTVSTLSFPDNNKVCQEGTNVTDTQSTINFQWKASDNTTSYDLIVNNLASKAVTRYNNISVTNKEVTLDRAKSYSWQVVSKSNKTTQTATSVLWQFYLAGQGEENFAPYPATIISPASGATVRATNGQITLQWTGEDPDQDVLTYTVYIDKVNGLQDTNGTITNLTKTEGNYQVTSNTVYYWRIKSSDGSSSSFTQVYSFRVE